MTPALVAARTHLHRIRARSHPQPCLSQSHSQSAALVLPLSPPSTLAASPSSQPHFIQAYNRSPSQLARTGTHSLAHPSSQPSALHSCPHLPSQPPSCPGSRPVPTRRHQHSPQPPPAPTWTAADIARAHSHPCSQVPTVVAAAYWAPSLQLLYAPPTPIRPHSCPHPYAVAPPPKHAAARTSI